VFDFYEETQDPFLDEVRERFYNEPDLIGPEGEDWS